MRRLMPQLLALALVLCAAPAAGGEVTAQSAFERLKGLEGTWRGAADGRGEEAEAEAEAAGEMVHEIKLSANGSVVMETMSPGTPHEMINLYHLDGDDVVLTHYCSSGNQPRMRLDRERSGADRLVFDYDGGTNHDPAVDHHIHSAEIRWVGENRIESDWTAWGQGREMGGMTFHLAREGE
ncbi:MAG: hypothetical protein R3325_14835 [Thermoanaerobaculia bacterium]|nr:hypothetical protein [Thermoanaerobaculia bacterium]